MASRTQRMKGLMYSYVKTLLTTNKLLCFNIVLKACCVFRGRNFEIDILVPSSLSRIVERPPSPSSSSPSSVSVKTGRMWAGIKNNFALRKNLMIYDLMFNNAKLIVYFELNYRALRNMNVNVKIFLKMPKTCKWRCQSVCAPPYWIYGWSSRRLSVFILKCVSKRPNLIPSKAS